MECLRYANTNDDRVPSKTLNTSTHVVRFYEKEHEYVVNAVEDETVTWEATSVTTYLKPMLHCEKTHDDIIRSSRERWSKIETIYNTMTDEEIKTMWTEITEEAKNDGNIVHNMIDEALKLAYTYYNTNTGKKYDYLEKDARRLMTANIEKYKRSNASKIRNYKSEWLSFEAFLKKNQNYVVVATEVMLYDHVLNVAGTFDALFYDGSEKEFVLIDWKVSKKIGPNEFEEIVPSHPMLKNVNSGNYTLYSLQLSQYKNMIDRHGVHVDDNLPYFASLREAKIGKMTLVNLHSTFGGIPQIIRISKQFYDDVFTPLNDYEYDIRNPIVVKEDNETHSKKRKRQEECDFFETVKTLSKTDKKKQKR